MCETCSSIAGMYKNIRTYGLIAVFGILIVVSLQPTFIEATEHGLANHMVLEHSLFFITGVPSVMIAETVLRFLVFSERKRDTDLRKSKGRLTLIIGWSTLLRKIFTVNKFGFIDHNFNCSFGILACSLHIRLCCLI